MHLSRPLGALLEARCARDGATPLITYYDDATGERVELSGATTQNWVSKAANLLIEDLDLAPGAPVSVDAQAHWHTAVLVLAAWRAELLVGPGDAPHTVTLAWDSLATELAAQPDVCIAPPPGPDAPALVSTAGTRSQSELSAAAAAFGLPARCRLLDTHETWDADGLVQALAVPLVNTGSLVISRHTPADALDARIAAERVTARLPLAASPPL